MTKDLQFLVNEAKDELSRPGVMSPHYRKAVVDMAQGFIDLSALLDRWARAHQAFVNDPNDDIDGKLETQEIDIRIELLSHWTSLRSKFE